MTIRLIPLLLFTAAAPLIHAETLYDAELALKSGDPQRALAILAELEGKMPPASESEGRRLLALADVRHTLLQAKEEEILLRRIEGIPGMAAEVVGEAKRRQVRLLRDSRPDEALRIATNRLTTVPSGKDGDAMRLLVAELLMSRGRAEHALETLAARPVPGRDTGADATFKTAAERAKLVVSLRKRVPETRVSPETARYEKALADAGATARKSSRNGRVAYEKIADDVAAPSALRLRALTACAECAENAGDKDNALAAARRMAGFTGDTPAAIAAARIDAARIYLDLADDTARALSLAADALAILPPGGEDAEEARWLLARALVRRGAPVEEVFDAVAGSPAVTACPYPPDNPRHPVNRLVAARGSLARWMETDLERTVPRTTNAVLRAADECFAVKRYTEAARRYARAGAYGALPADTLAYAALQRARAVALSPEFKDAPALYRKFLTEKELVRSDYAPDALLRAGTFCEGRLRDGEQGREFLRLAYERYPATEPGQSALIFLAESLADSGKRAEAIGLYRDYLKKYPSGHHTGAAKKFLSELESPKK